MKHHHPLIVHKCVHIDKYWSPVFQQKLLQSQSGLWDTWTGIPLWSMTRKGERREKGTLNHGPEKEGRGREEEALLRSVDRYINGSVDQWIRRSTHGSTDPSISRKDLQNPSFYRSTPGLWHLSLRTADAFPVVASGNASAVRKLVTSFNVQIPYPSILIMNHQFINLPNHHWLPWLQLFHMCETSRNNERCQWAGFLKSFLAVIPPPSPPKIK